MMHFCYTCGKAIDAEMINNKGKICPYCSSLISELLDSDTLIVAQQLFTHRNYSIREITNGGYDYLESKKSTLPTILFNVGVKLISSPKFYSISRVDLEIDSVQYTTLLLKPKPISFVNAALNNYLAIRSRYIQSIYDWIYTLN